MLPVAIGSRYTAATPETDISSAALTTVEDGASAMAARDITIPIVYLREGLEVVLNPLLLFLNVAIASAPSAILGSASNKARH
jgi:hypothetical protein